MNDFQFAYDRVIRPIEDQMIRSIWRIVRSTQDADEAMQDALVTIWKRWERILRHSNPRALILKICIDAAYDQTRRSIRDGRQHVSCSQINEPVDLSPTPPQAMQDSEQVVELIAAIHRLPRNQATATLMRVVQEQSYSDIAAAIGCSEVTARKHVKRGRERLKIVLCTSSHRGAT